MAKFDPLKWYLSHIPEEKNDITLSFEQIEKIIQDKLPKSAYIHRAWWSNEENGVHVSAHTWMDAGWKVDAVNQRERWVRFIRRPSNLPMKTKIIPETPRIKDNPIFSKRTMFSANRPVKTLVIHKPECRVIPWEKLDSCGCGDMGELGNQHWFCETHITHTEVDAFMNGKFWAILICDICFGKD